MVRSLAVQKGVENVMILDKAGMIRFSSDPEERGRILDKRDPTCEICHKQEASVRGRTVVFEAGEKGRVFRNVNPIMNSESCFSCHPPEDRINGVLIVDYSLEDLEQNLAGIARTMWTSALLLGLAITTVVIVFMRRIVLRRLRGLVRAIDTIESGELSESIEDDQDDEIGILGRHLNQMSHSLHRVVDNLRQRESFLDAILNSADDGMVVIDQNNRVVATNLAFDRLVGSEEGELIRNRCRCVGMANGEERNGCPARMTLENRRGIRRIWPVEGETGKTRYYEVSTSPLKDPVDGPQVLEVWRDITERRELEATLAQSERLASLGLLASGVSHEINNPLASITTCLDGLSRRLRSARGTGIPEELPEYLGLIRGEVERCRDLTSRLKRLGQKPSQTLQSVNLQAVVHDVLDLLRYEAQDHCVEIRESMPSRDIPVITDASQVRQVVLNVLLNGIQAVDPPGWVRVSLVHSEAQFAEIEISDSGRGIDPGSLDRIFEPFYSSRPDGRGTGLGLFISKIIVDQLGGSIAVASSTAAGTCFRILIPYGRTIRRR